MVKTTTSPGPDTGNVLVNTLPLLLVCVSTPGSVVTATVPFAVAVVTCAWPGTSPCPMPRSELSCDSRVAM